MGNTVKPKDRVITGRGPAPSTKLRQAVFAACGQRAEHASNLWLVYCARHERHWVLTSDVEYLHFLSLEFDPEVAEVNFKPDPDIVRLRDEDRKTIFDAIVRFRDGHTECRELKREATPPPEPEEELRAALQQEAQQIAAKRHGGSYLRLTLADLDVHQIRIQNTLRMLRFLGAAQGEPLAAIRQALILAVRQAGPTRLDVLAASLHDHDQAYAYAAVFQLVQRRQLSLPIDTEVITGKSLVGGAP